MNDDILNKKLENEQQELDEKALDRKSSAQEKHNLKSWLTSVLRRASFRWGPRSQCLRNGRVARGLYECTNCKGHFSVSKKEIKVDHIIPVVSITTGFQFRPNGLPDWNEFIDRLFCPVEGLQLLCNTCHDSKTQIEDTMRAEFNQKRKTKEKEILKDARKNEKVNKRLTK